MIILAPNKIWESKENLGAKNIWLILEAKMMLAPVLPASSHALALNPKSCQDNRLVGTDWSDLGVLHLHHGEQF